MKRKCIIWTVSTTGLTAGSFLTLIAEHFCVRFNSAKAMSILLSSMTEAATGSLVFLSITEHYTSAAQQR